MLWSLRPDKLVIPPPEKCLPGRAVKMPVPDRHHVNGHALDGPYPPGLELAQFGMGFRIKPDGAHEPQCLGDPIGELLIPA